VTTIDCVNSYYRAELIATIELLNHSIRYYATLLYSVTVSIQGGAELITVSQSV